MNSRAGSIQIDVRGNPVVRCCGMALTGRVLRKKDIARMKGHACAVAETDVHATSKGNDPTPSRRSVKIDNVRRESGSNQKSYCRHRFVQKLGMLAGIERFKMRLPIGP